MKNKKNFQNVYPEYIVRISDMMGEKTRYEHYKGAIIKTIPYKIHHSFKRIYYTDNISIPEKDVRPATFDEISAFKSGIKNVNYIRNSVSDNYLNSFTNVEKDDILVSLTYIKGARQIGDIFKVIKKCNSHSYIYYKVHTTSNSPNTWRKATQKEIEYFNKGNANINTMLLEINNIPNSYDWKNLKTNDYIVSLNIKYDNPDIPNNYIFKTNHGHIDRLGLIDDIYGRLNGFAENNKKHFRIATKEEAELYKMVGRPIDIKYIDILKKAKAKFPIGTKYKSISSIKAGEFTHVAEIKGSLRIGIHSDKEYFITDGHAGRVFHNGYWASVIEDVDKEPLCNNKYMDSILTSHPAILRNTCSEFSIQNDEVKLLNPSRKKKKLIKLD